MGDDARTRYTAAVTARAARQRSPARVAMVGETAAAAALTRRYGWTVAPDLDAADALAVALPAGTFGGAADAAVRTALRRGLPILMQIGDRLAAFPDCWATPIPGGYQLQVPAEPEPEPGPATAATLTYLGITPAPKRSVGPGHDESPKAAPPSMASAPFPAFDTSTSKSSGSGSGEDSKASSGQDLSNPSASTAEQEAEQALRGARREVTAAAIAKLAPHPMPHDDPEERSAWLQLVRGGMTPTPAAVAGLVASTAARSARRARVAAELADIAKRDAAAAAATVARILADTGTGPTWTELGRVMGWPINAARSSIVPRLLRACWLTSTPEPRSLRPGPRHTNTPR